LTASATDQINIRVLLQKFFMVGQGRVGRKFHEATGDVVRTFDGARRGNIGAIAHVDPNASAGGMLGNSVRATNAGDNCVGVLKIIVCGFHLGIPKTDFCWKK
jgi:hypothetical protein